MNGISDNMQEHLRTMGVFRGTVAQAEYEYLRLLGRALALGKKSTDRTGTGTFKLWGPQIEFDLSEGLPLLTTKKVHLRSVIHELLWFLTGDTNIKYLKDNGVSIWDEWADEKGELGPVYGHQWRSWPGQLMDVCSGERTDDAEPLELEYTETFKGRKVSTGYPSYDAYLFHRPIDQISDALELLRKDPDSRRIIVTAWNPADVPKQKLPPCHCFFQFGTFLDEETGKRTLNLKVYMRSVDIFLGLPFNITSYALLQHMFAQQVDMIPGQLVMTFGDAHLYSNHVEQAKEQLSRRPSDHTPVLELDRAASLFDYKFEDFNILGYYPKPAIKAPVAV